MRWLISLFAICFCISVKAQINSVWTKDTSRVGISVNLDDTIYYLREKYASGEWMIYYDGTYTRKCAHIKYHGEFQDDSTWYQNGRLMRVRLWKNQITMFCYDLRKWYPDGSIHTITYCNGDSMITNCYYQSGNVERVCKAYKDSSSNAMWEHYEVEYYENRQLKSDPVDINGSAQPIKYYYESGKVSREATWEFGSFLGPYREWYENGQVKVDGQYEAANAENRIRPPLQIGTWSYYNESGKLIKEEFYEEGKLVKTVEY